MSGYMFATGTCYGCKRLFTFNPHLVPSISVKGEREPICRDCVVRVNPMRQANGLEPIVLLPGAYEPSAEDDRPFGDAWFSSGADDGSLGEP